MADNAESVSESVRTVNVEYSYRTRDGEKTDSYQLSHHESEKLLELALRDSLDGVDARVIQNEIEARSE